jgi:single-stranded-DNA-specific exonuclease
METSLAKRWEPKSVPEANALKGLSEALKVDRIIAALLIQRGHDTFEKAKAFFRPELTALENPFLMKGMEAAVTRLEAAVAKQETILLYGDYDVDGTTAVSVMYDFLSPYCPSLLTYIPDRYKEGYGLSLQAIEWAREQKVALMITLDCGIRNPDKIDRATKYGIDVIVCDHHEPGAEVPDCIAVLDPKQRDCPYPFKELSGCGVGFKLIQAYAQRRGMPDTLLHAQLDLLAISIASDIVPMVGENRILAYHGLHQLNEHPRPGMAAMMELAGLQPPLDISRVVFGIGPRINAAGRIEHGKHAVSLMMAKDKEKAADLAAVLEGHNAERKTLDKKITEEALEMIATDPFVKGAWSTVLFKEDWNKGVVGIVASRCIEHYFRPTIILTRSGEVAAGSARSVEGFNLFQALEECKDSLIQFGGHTHAAGLSLEIRNIPAFRAKFDEVARKHLTESQRVPVQPLDLWVEPQELNKKLWRILQQMAPFGPGNMQPVFALKGLRQPAALRLLKEQHLKFELEVGDGKAEAIGFQMRPHWERIAAGETFDLCFSLQLNIFKDLRTLQLAIRDIRFSENETFHQKPLQEV